MNILGISCYFHDSAVCLLENGKIVAAAQEERFTRQKYSAQFPINAINYCMEASNIAFDDLDYIGFYEKPFLKFSRVIINHLKSYPFSLKNFLDVVPSWLEDRLILPLTLKREICYEKRVLFIRHHLSHAASAFLVSPFSEAAILTADGVGEYATTTLGVGKENKIRILQELHYPDSLGLLYTAVTTYLGFKANRGEGKVMGLAGYGKPVYLDEFEKIVKTKQDGSFKIDESFFGFNKGRMMYSRKFIKMFGVPRISESNIEQRHCDIAASLQCFIEEVAISMAKKLYSITKLKKLCLAGGVFLNCVVNHKILECLPFDEIFIQPAAGDSGGALGVAYYTYNCLLGNPRNYIMDSTFLGPMFSKDQIEVTLLNSNLQFEELEDKKLLEYIAEELANNKIVGWFQNRMEFGPRALGNRSILANPCNPNMKELLNSKVKKRESFRPYGAAVLEGREKEFFKLQCTSPFMLLASMVKTEKRRLIPAITHIDGTARVQTVGKSTNLKFWQLIKKFENITGVPILINTSLNLKGEPIACTPEDAISCFQRSEMDYLVLGNYVVKKEL